ncbi:Rhamnolipids biosynthesis 3-oxoacyl-[acyl-carrier-protein] reductase [Tolypocladium ophioglossoides CBS 100239]|uniref:Rhamnolipids biosynthesis 3-oxoacyl-[acyl-carrier-protein] reductase n=1 Tax=Tolypocladium ophioglossoides (strain CBS 100239) TaxID=1163406 RepID=A0A0L0N992_TOLOC|nr:Rhamnolipids biosynthesis 3-oxoacyl-[acyl-carrier-protein] reductase [Tolypocladium ophioglossoides CBS 100239]
MSSASQPNDGLLEASSLFNVNGLVALVTGGGSGIGFMLAKALAKNGASKVYIAGRRLEVLQNAAKSIGPNVATVTCDVTSKESLQKAVEFVEKEAGYLNLLVCNSGISGPQVAKITPQTTLEQFANDNFSIDVDKYTETFAVNSVAVWYTAMAFLKLLDKGNQKKNVRQSSQIVVVSSIAGFNKKQTGGFAYGQSKAAATHTTKMLAVALPQANCIAPGIFPSDMSAPFLTAVKDESGEYGAMPKDMIPMQRLGEATDMAGTMLYLASGAGAYCNGVVVVLDGGRLGTFPSVN